VKLLKSALEKKKQIENRGEIDGNRNKRIRRAPLRLSDYHTENPDIENLKLPVIKKGVGRPRLTRRNLDDYKKLTLAFKDKTKSEQQLSMRYI
jgi:hypothetical protein